MKYPWVSTLILGAAAVASPMNAQTTGPKALMVASTTPAETPGLHERGPRYQLHASDTFAITFDLSPEFDQTVTVEPDGFIALKGAGSIYVTGLTVPELTDAIKRAYVSTLHTPIVTVSLKDFEKPYFIASGQVEKPGKYDLRGDVTVTEAIAIAGGFTSKSKHSQVVLFRPVPSGGYESKVLNVKQLLASRSLSEDSHLQPGDLIYVPQNAFSKIKPFLPTSNVGVYVPPGTY
jgi:polysaccharide biosynthesis/export protein